MTDTGTRIPRMHARPPIIFGSKVIRSNFIVCSPPGRCKTVILAPRAASRPVTGRKLRPVPEAVGVRRPIPRGAASDSFRTINDFAQALCKAGLCYFLSLLKARLVPRQAAGELSDD